MNTIKKYNSIENRLEGFDKFYQFHLETLDCCPEIVTATYLANHQEDWDFEKRCSYAFWHGTTYCGPTEIILTNEFPVIGRSKKDIERIKEFFLENKKKLIFASDCKYRKLDFLPFMDSVGKYLLETSKFEILGEMVKSKLSGKDTENYLNLQKEVFDNWYSCGRMFYWCFAEALKMITSKEILPPTMEFGPGGNSHTSGWAFVMGRDDLVKKIDDGKSLTKEEISNLETSARDYLYSFKEKHYNAQLADFFTLETACCNYKRQHKGTRYGGNYIDEQWDEIQEMKSHWDGPKYNKIWENYINSRQRVFPSSMLFENFNKSGKAYQTSWHDTLKDYGRMPRVEAWFNSQPQLWQPIDRFDWYGDSIFDR